MTIVTEQTRLQEYVHHIIDSELRAMCQEVIDHPRFNTQFGSAGEHHAYPGGLVVHTFEVVKYAYQMTKMFPKADLDVVLTAAIFHDFMKIAEYQEGCSGVYLAGPDANGYYYNETTIEPVKTPYRNLIRHVAGSYAKFMVALDETDVSEEKAEAIGHAILAHHGRKEWGSPIEPQTVEAYIVHTADMFSVRFGTYKDAITND